MKKKILIKAPLLTRSGYGEQARFALRSLRSREDLFDIYVIPLNWGQTSWVPDYNDEKNWIDETIEKTIAYIEGGGKFDISLQVTIPNEFERLSCLCVGYTAGIETTKVSHQWIQKCNEMDKVIVVSNHAKNVFENTEYTGTVEETGEQVELKSTANIDVVNYPVKKYKSLNLDLNLKHDINFLCVAQMGPRKNLANTIKWFIEEFHDEEVGLVVKTNLSKNSVIDRTVCFSNLKNLLSNWPDRKCSVHLLHGDLTDQEMHSLYKHEKINAFVCLSHGEGYGLPFFEAAYSDVPVVAIGWSGQCDFLFDDKGKEMFYNVAFDLQKVPKEAVWEPIVLENSMWAYPREASSKEKMRECYNDIINNEGHVKNTKKYSKYLRNNFSEEIMYDKFVKSIWNPSEEELEWLKVVSEIEVL
tara:strand:- start:5763 stop:7007 length:1245 start_codon:yes stop_codon:yes gene_type:complete